MRAGPRIRRAGPEDVTALAALFRRVRRENVPAIPPIAHPPETVEPFLAGVVRASAVWLAEEETGPVAFLALGDDGEVEHLYVRRDRTGTGLGASLLGLAKEAHPEGLALWTFAANAGARRFYARHGFVEVGGTEGENDEGEPDIRMEWVPGGGVRAKEG